MELLWSLALLACSASMGVMMWMMMRSSHSAASRAPAEPATSEELAPLRREVQQLRADRNGDVRAGSRKTSA
ncbi:MAG: hypothetical protein ACRDRZ_13560 [Pseudonocardiaceae bacterium]